jgi:hypothetical protein
MPDNFVGDLGPRVLKCDRDFASEPAQLRKPRAEVRALGCGELSV